MKYKKGTRRKAIDYEKDIVLYWQNNKTFEKSIAMRPESNAFVFYDGPPFLTGTPHHGHLLISSVKDAVARYQTMKGRRVERRWGWDCHGLPAEVFVEKKLGIKNKKEIGVKISIADYVKECRSAMVQTGTEWEDTISRLGRWVEFKGAYKTMDNEYMESVWWAFKKLYEEGAIYEGEKILVYCTKDATPISKSEVAMENSYQQDTDPSVYVYFQIEDRDEYLLAWTTTPWTLPANVAIAVNKHLEYVLVKHKDKKFYVAKNALERILTDDKHQPLNYDVIKTIKGSELVGLRYHPLFENRGPNAHRVLNADFVTELDGTGIVHEAPAYGEEDYDLCKQENVPIVSIVDENGMYTEGRWQAQNIWDVNKEIAKTLVAEDKALKIEYIVHDYPHCHRCGTKLMYRAHPSWFMDIQAQKQKMLKSNEETNWTPKHLQQGRFKNIIESAPDWNLSRDRYWATPIPVWKGVRNDGTEVIKVIGSYEELEKLAGKKLDDYHLPNVMNITFNIDDTKMYHVGKVLDCWFESGSMPFAQFHYPFENVEKFETSFPADFVVEAIDQTRGWFYSLTAVNVALFGKAPFKNLICTGFINAGDGRKMSKKLKNYTDPMELMDQYSVDAFRFLMLGSPLLNGEDFNLKDRDVGDVARKLGMIWNMYDFFTLYAEVDNWEWKGSLSDPYNSLKHPLDQWIVSRIHALSCEVDSHMQKYDLPNALKPIVPFIDDASNWYVRRSRKRFWKSESDEDKILAYTTLHYVLVRLSMIMAPFTPFLAEELHRKLTGGDSVHLKDWATEGVINETIVAEMTELRRIITDGLSQRVQAGIKVRYPLARISASGQQYALLKKYEDIICEELNVKTVEESAEQGVEPMIDIHITPELELEGLARELVRYIQASRKEAGFNIDDRIQLSIRSSSKDINEAVDSFRSYIAAEALVKSFVVQKEAEYTEKTQIEDHNIEIAIARD